MEQSWRERLIARLDETGMTMKALSQAINTSDSYIRDILKRGTEPTLSKLAAIAEALGVSVDWLLHGTDTAADMQQVAISGYVGAGETVIPLDDLAQETVERGTRDGDRKNESEYPDMVEAPASLGRVAALIVRGDSMEPVYHEGDIIFYRRYRGHPGDIVGRECVVETEGGELYLKRLRQGSKEHLFHLLSYQPGVDPIFDVKLRWAGVVEWVKKGQALE